MCLSSSDCVAIWNDLLGAGETADAAEQADDATEDGKESGQSGAYDSEALDEACDGGMQTD